MSPTHDLGGNHGGHGMLLGTAAYMSPEQAKGKAVDRRADIWSFGVVLLELISGRRVFEGETISETLAAVIMKEVDLGGLPGDTPTPVRRLLQRCLERDPDKRLRDIGEARIRIEEVIAAPQLSEDPAPVMEPRKGSATRLLPWLIAAAAIAGLVWGWLGRPAETAPLPVMRFTMSIASDQPLADTPIPTLAISPDGTRIAYTGELSDSRAIYLRQVNQLEATVVQGTERGDTPFFSPDGEWIGFESGGKLKKVSVLGGPPTTLCDAPRLRGASWGADGTIVFAPDRSGGLMRVSDAGGEPESLTDFETKDSLGAPSHRWPEVLPDGRTVIYTSTSNNGNYVEAEIMAISLEDGSVKTLIKPANFARFVAPGFLVYVRGNTLFAARFDPVAVELTGPAVPVLEGIRAAANFGCAQLTVSTNGTLVYLSGALISGNERLVWTDRQGNSTFASSLETELGGAELSPDGQHVALELVSEAQSDFSLWVLELARDTRTRLTFEDTTDLDPIWTPDGRWLIYSGNGGDEDAEMNLFRRRADGTGEAERLTTSRFRHHPTSWSRDGTVLAFIEDNDETGADLMLYRPGADPEVEVFLKTPFNEWLPFISPDGRWVLYGSNQSGDAEIYVRSLQGSGQQIRVSTDGSAIARWSPDRDELFYRNLDDKMMSVRFKVHNGLFIPESPVELFQMPVPPHSFKFQAVPGGRFLSYRDSDDMADETRDPVAVINWSAELEAKVPQTR